MLRCFSLAAVSDTDSAQDVPNRKVVVLEPADQGAAALIAWTKRHSSRYSPSTARTFEATFANDLKVIGIMPGYASCGLTVSLRLSNDYGRLSLAAAGALQAIAYDTALRSTGTALAAPCSFHISFMHGLRVGSKVMVTAEMVPAKSVGSSAKIVLADLQTGKLLSEGHWNKPPVAFLQSSSVGISGPEAAKKHLVGRARAVTEHFTKDEPFNSFSLLAQHLQDVTTQAGQCSAKLQPRPELHSKEGPLHVGALPGLSDMVAMAALTTLGKYGLVGIDMFAEVYDGLTVGAALHISARALHAGKTLAFTETCFRDEVTGSIVALIKQTFLVRGGAPPLPPPMMPKNGLQLHMQL